MANKQEDKELKDQHDSQLPDQSSFFKTEKLKKSARAGTQLPDPKIEPFGYDPKAKFRHLFPELDLPPLFSESPDDYVSFGHSEMPANTLYFGDNLYILRNLPSESIDLIYIDPPFFSKRDYVQIWGDDNEIRSFQDIFEDGMFSYIAWLNARLWEMKRVLKNTGSIYVHCDWHASHYIKTEMDKIFGYDNFLNDISWRRSTPTGGKVKSKMFPRDYDSILWYAKDKGFEYKNIYLGYAEEYIKKFFNHDDGDGRKYALQTVGDYSQQSIEEFRKQGRIYQTKMGTYD